MTSKWRRTNVDATSFKGVTKIWFGWELREKVSDRAVIAVSTGILPEFIRLYEEIIH